MKRQLLMTSAAGALLLCGCTTQTTEPSEVAAQTGPTTATETTATPQQLASVIAEYESSWRETASKQAECRLIWVLDSPDDAISNLQGTTCYMNEQTAVITAGTALKKLDELAPPTELETLVERTKSELDVIADLDIVGVCGTGDWPAESDECNEVLGSNSFYFGLLVKTLDAWKPYL